MTTIYLIRHAEAEGNLYRVFQGRQDVQLTERGKLQVRALAERFRGIPVDAVYTSDLARAAETAAGICRVQGLPLHRDPGLREICVGSWEGRPLGEVSRQEPEQLEYFRRDLKRWQPGEGAESVTQVTERMLASLQRIAAAHDGGSAAVVSHGAAIRYVLGAIEGASLEEISRMPTGENTGVTVLTAEAGVLRVLRQEDAAHLDEWMEKLSGRPYRKHKTGLQVGLWYRQPAAQERADWLRAALNGAGEIPGCGEADVLLGIRGEEPVGVVALAPELGAPGEGWIGALWVQPEHRGSGYGSQLLGQAVQRFRRLGRETLCAVAEEGDEAALAFAEAHGFRRADVPAADGRVLLRKDIAVRPPEL